MNVDLHLDPLTTAEAAALAQVKPQDIRTWKTRGHLRPFDTDHRGRPLYLGIEVLRAEAAISLKPQSHRRQQETTWPASSQTSSSAAA